VSIDSFLRLLLYNVGVVSSAADFNMMMIHFVVLLLYHGILERTAPTHMYSFYSKSTYTNYYGTIVVFFMIIMAILFFRLWMRAYILLSTAEK
jgi:hypothetical protein